MKKMKYKKFASGGPVDPLLGFTPREPTPRQNLKKDWVLPRKTTYGPRELDAQKQWLESYVSSDKYAERLGAEGISNPRKEQSARLSNLKNTKVIPVKAPIGKDVNSMAGVYVEKKGDVDIRGKKYKAGSVYLQSLRDDAYFATDMDKNFLTPMHELGHALDDNGNRIPQKTKQALAERLNAPEYEGDNYLQTPSEFTNRLTPIRYLLNTEGIYDARRQEFTPQHYDEMMKSNKLKNTRYLKEVMSKSGKTDEDKKKNFIWFMNNIADTTKPESTRSAATGGYIGKEYATGGGLPGMDMIAPALMNLIPQAINIGQSANSTPTYDPQAKGGFDFSQMAGAAAASGGLGPLGIIAGGLNAVGQLVKSNKAKHTNVYGSPGQYASGGDMTLNNQAFKVNAPANKTDAKYYPSFDVNLDNNEVVDASRKIVYSDDIKNPTTGNSFATDAAKLEYKKGLSQKKVERYKDPFASNTIEALDRMGRDLYSKQEVIATAMGKRNNQGATVQKANMGGPLDPITMAQESTRVNPLPMQTFNAPVNIDPMFKNLRPGVMEELIKTNRAQAESFFRDKAPTTGTPRTTFNSRYREKQYGGPIDPITGQPIAVQQLMQQYPQRGYQLTSNEWQNLSEPGMYNNPDSRVPTQVQPTTTNAYPNMRTATAPPTYGQDNITPNQFLNLRGNPTAPTATSPRPAGRNRPSTSVQSSPTGPVNTPPTDNFRFYNEGPNGSIDDGFRFMDPSGETPKRFPNFAPLESPASSTNMLYPNSLANRTVTSNRALPTAAQLNPLSTTAGAPQDASAGRSMFTTGDYLQMGAAAASFAPLLQGPQRETPYLDNTQITKQAFDVNPQLYQSGRSYRNAVNSIDTQSPNLRRALQNSLYAQKLNTDNQVIQQYQGMNNQAQQQYEANISNQRRYNIGQTVKLMI